MNPLTALPPRVRKWIYVGYSTLGITFGAVQVGFATAQADQPIWLGVSFGVFAYLGTALGLVAASNTSGRTKAAAKEFAAELNRQAALARRIGEDAGKSIHSQTHRDQ